MHKCRRCAAQLLVRSLETRLKRDRLAVEVRERVEVQLATARAHLDAVLNPQQTTADGATAATLAAPLETASAQWTLRSLLCCLVPRARPHFTSFRQLLTRAVLKYCYSVHYMKYNSKTHNVVQYVCIWYTLRRFVLERVQYKLQTAAYVLISSLLNLTLSEIIVNARNIMKIYVIWKRFD